MSNFMKIRPLEVEFYADGQRDKMKISVFAILRTRLKAPVFCPQSHMRYLFVPHNS